jgi:uncharacterized protein with PQ loop repeat
MKKHKTMTLAKESRGLAMFATLVAVVEPIMTIPQAREIWVNKSAANISLLTWGFALFAAAVWLIYALNIKNKPLLVSSVLWVAVEGTIVLGILVYR